MALEDWEQREIREVLETAEALYNWIAEGAK